METYKDWDKVEDARIEFNEALEGLKEVHTPEDLEAQKVKVAKAKENLFKVDGEFRRSIQMRKAEAKARADALRREGEMKKLQIQTELGKYEMMRLQARSQFPILTSRKLPQTETSSPDDLVCPICHKGDMGNVINDQPACFRCMHKLVSRKDLKNYNREYRRRFKKNKRKKK